ncbi:MAG: proline dehydrogenase family protein [Gemmatimonadetes bacterium]|nr:proline dehydrogenase family protein [Gemmatimonadota bacterium]MBM4191364.1 proline dehydrogenase [Gemmatimonadota bacterium]
MPIGRSLLLAAAQSPTLNRFALKSPIVKRATRAFMPGERPEEALDAGAALTRDGRGLIYTKLGEALTSLADADQVRDHYRWFYDQIAARTLPAEVSIKPTQLGLDQSERACLDHCLALAEKAAAVGSVLWLDMEDSAYVDRTLALYEAIKAKFPRTGLALQAYLFRTPKDLERLRAIDPVIRLVKGAYMEPAHIAFPKKADTDAAYEAIARTMLEMAAAGRARAVFGTHDMPLVRRIIGHADRMGLAKGRYEFHMLYGIRAKEQERLRAEGFPVTTLISYGDAWYRWYMRRLAERPANVWFVVKSALG